MLSALPVLLILLQGHCCASTNIVPQQQHLRSAARHAARIAASAAIAFTSLSHTANEATASTFSQSIERTSLTFADESIAQLPVYFGVGCFWHVQHEFIEAEKRILDRTDEQLTSIAGYAGSTLVGKDDNNPTNSKGLVCYHNLLGKGDYGKLGYGEVVQVRLPSKSVDATHSDQSKFREFADVYFSLFGADNERPDKGDRGSEYRSIVGIPGGVNGPYFKELKMAADAKGLQLEAGKGRADSDTLGKKKVWVLDSNEFPFRQAEVYHQFHDGFFPGEQYPESYNSLVKGALQRGLVMRTGCPDI